MDRVIGDEINNAVLSKLGWHVYLSDLFFHVFKTVSVLSVNGAVSVINLRAAGVGGY